MNIEFLKNCKKIQLLLARYGLTTHNSALHTKINFISENRTAQIYYTVNPELGDLQFRLCIYRMYMPNEIYRVDDIDEFMKTLDKNLRRI